MNKDCSFYHITMGLVGYSDSEGSDDEDVKLQTAKASTTSATSETTHKSKLEKVASGNKIKVNLPGAPASISIKEDDTNNDRPAKRAKTNSAFSGINSFLPAPKNPGAKASGSGGASLLSSGRGSGLGRGISLKTGAAPAFSRDRPEVDSTAFAQGADDGDYDEFGRRKEAAIGLPTTGEQTTTQEETGSKPAGKPMMFKPLSVGRKPTKKKTSLQTLEKSSSVATPEPREKARPVHETNTAIPTAVTATKAKQSLFFNYEDKPAQTHNAQIHNDYQPEFIDTRDAEEPLQDQVETIPAPAPPQSNAQPPTNDLQSLASTLNLTKAQQRQLFGRGDVSSAKLTNFNLAQEYSANNQLMQDEANAPVQNPVRAIAPGKHSLQQLANQVANQRDALEESFASSKRNKAAAGSKYGW